MLSFCLVSSPASALGCGLEPVDLVVSAGQELVALRLSLGDDLVGVLCSALRLRAAAQCRSATRKPGPRRARCAWRPAARPRPARCSSFADQLLVAARAAARRLPPGLRLPRGGRQAGAQLGFGLGSWAWLSSRICWAWPRSGPLPPGGRENLVPLPLRGGLQLGGLPLMIMRSLAMSCSAPARFSATWWSAVAPDRGGLAAVIEASSSASRRALLLDRICFLLGQRLAMRRSRSALARSSAASFSAQPAVRRRELSSSPQLRQRLPWPHRRSRRPAPRRPQQLLDPAPRPPGVGRSRSRSWRCTADSSRCSYLRLDPALARPGPPADRRAGPPDDDDSRGVPRRHPRGLVPGGVTGLGINPGSIAQSPITQPKAGETSADAPVCPH